jgi:hypothetical protein
MVSFAVAPFSPLSPSQEAVLIGLQACQVLFLAIHDWVPLGSLNDVAAVKGQDTRSRLIGVTLLQTAPFAFGLLRSALDFGRPYPGWLMRWLFISYLILLIGQLRAWWLPYLLVPEPRRADRSRAMFARTHSFLPERNGITPNTAHLLLHLATFITLCVLLIR